MNNVYKLYYTVSRRHQILNSHKNKKSGLGKHKPMELENKVNMI